MRARVAFAAALGAAGSALPALPAHAAECVKVVVDYGTMAGAPSGPDTRCTDVPDDAVAAHALQGRARYKGNFLCAIDGYPESGCGDEPPSPYWSFWVWRSGRWVYSSEGVATYPVSDTDKDGHPDPLGFRFHPVDAKAAPRANPSYPAPKPSPTRTTNPPARTTTAPPAVPATRPAGEGSNPAPSTKAPRATRTVTPTASPTTPPPTATGTPVALVSPDPKGGGIPIGTAAGAALAAGLIAAAAVRARKSP